MQSTESHRITGGVLTKGSPSFSEEKEAKRLYFSAASKFEAMSGSCRLRFLQKKKTLP
jgi:hypothetical protein